MYKTKTISIAFKQHNHNACWGNAMQAAQEYCDKHKLKFTPARRKVLELLLSEHRALGAYKILDLLREAGFKSQPPVAYRALEFLVENGFAHKIERLNAFVACTLHGTEHSPTFMICRQCENVAETYSPASNLNLSKSAEASGFKIEQTIIEAKGVCNSCAKTEVL